MEARRKQLMQQSGYDDFASASPASPRKIGIPLPRRTPAPNALHRRLSDAHTTTSHAVAGPSSQPSAAWEKLSPSKEPVEHVHVPRPPSPASHNTRSATPRITCKGWDVSEMCETYDGFRPVKRVSALHHDELEKALAEYEEHAEPLIIQDWHKLPNWPGDILSLEWLLANLGDKDIHVRNVHDRKDSLMKLSQFVEKSRSQEPYHVPGEQERLYWKDAECPAEWRDWLQGALPSSILPSGSGDLFQHLYPSEAVESLLCYLGIGDTYTPAHKDLCASSGHNLMCFSENDGSSFWFMTRARAASQAAEYFQEKLGEELDWETHVTTIQELADAPFEVYVAEQKVGDLVLVPPRSVHQVVNRGGLAMKTSWSRMTLENLRMALRYELPVYRRVCRPEQYRVKTVLYRSLVYHTVELQRALASSRDDKNEIAKTLHNHVKLFDAVLQEEYARGNEDMEHILLPDKHHGGELSLNISASERVNLVPSTSEPQNGLQERHGPPSCNLACDFCGADIFQSFFECRPCRSSNADLQLGDGLLICPTCYVEGRTCMCEKMQPRQCRPFRVLLDDRNKAAKALRDANLPLPAPPLRTSDLRGDSGVFEAACILHRRRAHDVNPALMRKCRSEVHHEIFHLYALNCGVCHASKCFPCHLIAGTHVVQALITHSEDTKGPKGGKNYHAVHRDNAQNLRALGAKRFNVRGDVKQRLLNAALSFPRCKPGHSNLKLGFYDEEFVAHDPAPNPQNPCTPPSRIVELAADNGVIGEEQMSPLTELEDSPGTRNIASPSRTQIVAKDKHVDESDVISLEYSDEEKDDDPLPPSPARNHPSVTSPTPGRRQFECVFIQSARRNSSSMSIDSQSLSKRSRHDDESMDDGPASWQRGAPRRKLSSTKDNRSGPSSRSTSLDHVGEDYGADLVTALSKSHSSAPIFTEMSLSAPRHVPVAQRVGSRRIISSVEPEDEAGDETYRPRPSTSNDRRRVAAPISHKGPALLQDRSAPMSSSAHRIGPPKLPRNASIKKGLAQNSSFTREEREIVSVSATVVASSSADGLSQPSRKRKRPPGVPHSELQGHMERMKRDRVRDGRLDRDWEIRRKKARVTSEHEDTDEVVEILIDNGPQEPAFAPQSYNSAPQRPATAVPPRPVDNTSTDVHELTPPSVAPTSSVTHETAPSRSAPEYVAPAPRMESRPSQATVQEPIPVNIAGPSKVLDGIGWPADIIALPENASPDDRQLLFATVLRGLADTMASSVTAPSAPAPTLALAPAPAPVPVPVPAPDSKREEEIGRLHEVIRSLTEQLQKMHDEGERRERLSQERVARIENELKKELRKERQERAAQAIVIRTLEHRANDLEAYIKKVEQSQNELAIREQVQSHFMSMMPTVNGSVTSMVQQAVGAELQPVKHSIAQLERFVGRPYEGQNFSEGSNVHPRPNFNPENQVNGNAPNRRDNWENRGGHNNQNNGRGNRGGSYQHNGGQYNNHDNNNYNRGRGNYHHNRSSGNPSNSEGQPIDYNNWHNRPRPEPRREEDRFQQQSQQLQPPWQPGPESQPQPQPQPLSQPQPQSEIPTPPRDRSRSPVKHETEYADGPQTPPRPPVSDRVDRPSSTVECTDLGYPSGSSSGSHSGSRSGSRSAAGHSPSSSHGFSEEKPPSRPEKQESSRVEKVEEKVAHEDAPGKTHAPSHRPSTTLPRRNRPLRQ